MAIRYYHTQRGTLTLAAMTVAAVVTASAAYFGPSSPARLPLFALTVGFVALAWLFSSLTVEVNEREFRWYFGPGLWRYRLALSDIETTQVVRNSLANGFGIRVRPGFRLYNVSGLDAVELRLKSGDIRRIGSDDAQALAAALKT
ncbi:MAG TPA: hypothetical protein VMG39_04555 [Pseudolabrys sp.]|nr:hypothetical protein [Pseudolabrys sp.]